MTTPATASAPSTPLAPRPVRLAVGLVYARTALTVLGVVSSVVYQDRVLEVAGVAGGDAAQVARTFAGVGLVLGVAFALVAVAVWVVLAVFTGRGHGWARVVLTVLAGLGSLGALLGLGGVALTAAVGSPQAVPPAVTVVQALLSLALWAATVVLLWLPASSAFFRSAAAARAARSPRTA